ncbi:MAG TPA: ZIP family metal transporter [Candidatus Onthocola stercorigallinarum]|nr:ZIP family metal transporter [Candidatus Onthocola stercorigallinarum]
MNALLLTFLSGLFYLVGIIIYKFVKHKNELTVAAIACAAVVIIGLILFDLLPELIEQDNAWLFVFVILGFVLLFLIDKLIPHHHHKHHAHDEATKEHKDRLEHVSTITILALSMHNLIEGMALYSVSLESIRSGILMLIGVGLHNLPFGFQIAGTKNKLLVFLLVISAFLGGLVVFFFGNVDEFLQGVVMALSMGMLLHILLFELFKEIRENIRQKMAIYGIIIGVILLIIINLI